MEPEGEENLVELGFVKKVPHWQLHHRYFPSKVGGCPAWLELKNLPLPADLQCGSCGEPMSFLLEIYAPDNDDPTSFHRTLFVFACRKSGCMKAGKCEGVGVLRCCLPRKNHFYPYQAPLREPNLLDPHIQQPLCGVCGCLAPSTCSSCKKVYYCSRSHQILAWKSGHKEECAKIKNGESTSDVIITKTSAIFSEYEISIEPEVNGSESEDERPEDERLLDFKKTLLDMKPELNETPVDDLETFCCKSNDRFFEKFCKRVAENPQQILRYDRGGEPLLISSKNAPKTSDISKCSCDAARRFEFQITPQILNYLDQEETLEDGLDFGTILIYTCSRNCQADGSKYLREFAWIQLVEQDGSFNDSSSQHAMQTDSDSD